MRSVKPRVRKGKVQKKIKCNAYTKRSERAERKGEKERNTDKQYCTCVRCEVNTAEAKR